MTRTIERARQIIRMKYTYIKVIGIVLVTIVFPVSPPIFAQNIESVSTLSCKTWGQPNWTKFDDYLRKRGIQKTGARIREYDENIQSVTPVEQLRSFSDEIYLRWLLADTTIFYDIKILNDRQETIFETTSNQCGLKLPMALYTQVNDGIIIHVERNKDYNKGFNWGIGFYIRPLTLKEREAILDEMPGDQTQFPSESSHTAIVNYFLERVLMLDALTILEHYLEQNPRDEGAIRQYWEIVNDLRIKRF